ncbi:MAG: hypothetical protein M0P66_08825 [Salinivirgaceae bacterium]|nr:hypothetical protein [Salinivirgaceae bacterium]
MQNSEDKHIMDQIRSTLEDYQPQCTPKNWEKMSALLDQQPAIPKPANWKIWFNGFTFGILLSILFVGSYYLIINPNTSKIEQVKNDPVINSVDNINQSNRNNITANLPINSYSNATNMESNSRFSNSSRILQSINIKPEIVETFKNRQILFEEQAEQLNTIEKSEDLKLIAENDEIKTIIPIKTSQIVFDYKLIYEKELHINRYIPEKKIDKINEKSKKRLLNWGMFDFSFKMQDDLYKNFVGPDRAKVSYSPELIHGNFQSKSGVAQGAGLMLEGPISKGLSLGIGFYTRQYDWQKEKVFTSLHMGIPPDSTLQYKVDSIHRCNGKWKYFEVPFEVNLHFIHNGKTDICFNTSIAAIIMQSEKYQFDRIIEQTTNSQKQEPKPFSNYTIFGDIKIGLGYRYRLNERWSIWAEPYYKWSLKGIGDISYKPKSFGINVGVIYQFNLHKKK